MIGRFQKYYFFIFFFVVVYGCKDASETKVDREHTIEKKVDSVLALMTLEEKNRTNVSS